MGSWATGSRALRLGGIDPRATIAAFLSVAGPGVRRLADGIVRAVWTPAGPGTVLLSWSPGGDAVAEAWGGRMAVDWLLDVAPRWLGLHDLLEGWAPGHHPVVAELWRRRPGLRLPASGLLWDELAPTIVAQKVTGLEAHRSWRWIVRSYGGPAPGPEALGVRLAPSPEVIGALGYADLHHADLERRRAATVIRAARRVRSLERVSAMDAPAATSALRTIDGIGVWTATSTVALSHGDPDTVVLRDFWLPTIVRYALTGDRRWTDDDAVMLELLEPFAGHRSRVVQVITTAGIRPPRRAPRARVRSLAGF